MELLSLQALWALAAIIMIDIVLAGDNALVIGMAANRLPPHLKKKAILYGTIGAVAIRFIAVAFITYLLMVPGLKLVGSILLAYIGWRLVFQNHEHAVDAKDSLWSAIGTIIMADTVMSIENAFGIAAAANGNMSLVIFGLLVSVPIIMFGASIVSKILQKYPDTIYIGSFVLFVVAFAMVLKEPLLVNWWALADSWVLTNLPWVAGLTLVAVQYYRVKLRPKKLKKSK